MGQFAGFFFYMYVVCAVSMMRASGTREYQQSSVRQRGKKSRRRWRNLYFGGALARKQMAWQRRRRGEAIKSRRRGVQDVLTISVGLFYLLAFEGD